MVGYLTSSPRLAILCCYRGVAGTLLLLWDKRYDYRESGTTFAGAANDHHSWRTKQHDNCESRSDCFAS